MRFTRGLIDLDQRESIIRMAVSCQQDHWSSISYADDTQPAWAKIGQQAPT